MGDVTRILDELHRGDVGADQRLLAAVYDELRRVAAQRLVRERPGQTLQATALVHETYLKLFRHDSQPNWRGREHFFAAAAKAMDWILVDQARRKGATKRGGDQNRINIEASHLQSPKSGDLIISLHDALAELEQHHEDAANLVRLRFFAGMTNREAAEALGIGARSAVRLWTYARAWLHERIGDQASF